MRSAKPHPIQTPALRRASNMLEDKEPLQVRIPVAVKRQFKAHAALNGLEPNELFVAVWRHYEASLEPGAASGEGS